MSAQTSMDRSGPPFFPPLGIGAGSLANAEGEAAFAETVRAAWERGIRYFDTSALYLGGESERRLGAALAGLPRARLRISTKLGRYQDHAGSSIDPGGANSRFDYSAETALRSVERSLGRLGVDRLDAVYLHDLDPDLCGDAYRAHFESALEGAYPALRRLQEQGVVGAIGVAAMDWRACLAFARAAELDVVMPAGEHSLLRTRAGPLLDHCLNKGIAWIAASPFNSGILATGARPGAFYHMRPAGERALERVRALEAICARYRVPLAAAALHYPLRHPAVSTVVFGAKSAAEFEESHRLFSLDLDPEFWGEIEDFVTADPEWESR